MNQTYIDNLTDSWENQTPANPNKGIYQMDVDLFGCPPDVDGEEKIYVLIFRMPGAILGYFSPNNEYPDQMNEMEIIHINATIDPSSDLLLATVAHEFQHMIHFNNDPDEDLWLDEGCAMFAEVNCGWYDESLPYINGYGSASDRPLNSWSIDGNTTPDYGKAVLFMLYLSEQFGGNSIIGQLAQNATTGFASIQNTIQAAGYSTNFAEIYLNWIIANFVDNPDIPDGQYGYPNYDFAQFSSTNFYDVSSEISGTAKMYAYGTKYLKFRDPDAGTVDFSFDGEDGRLINIQAIIYNSFDDQNVETVTLNNTFEGTYTVNMSSVYQVVFAITSRYAAASDQAEVDWSVTPAGEPDTENVTLLSDNFDTYNDGDLSFGNWTTFDVDGAATGGLQDYTFPHSGEAFAWTVVDWSDHTSINAASGNNTIATMYNGNGTQNDDWAISPSIDMTPSEYLSAKVYFKTYIINSDYVPETVQVLVSTNGGTATTDFILVDTININSGEALSWIDRDVDLSDYLGENVKVALRYTSQDMFTVLVDDFEVIAKKAVAIAPNQLPLISNNHCAPNPFNPQTTINFHLGENTHTKVAVYNAMGKLVKTLINDNLASGDQNIIWNGDNNKGQKVASGLYFYKIESSDKNFQKTGKMLLIK